jgi:hypothetical protein
MKNFFMIMLASAFALTSCAGGNTEETVVEETTTEDTLVEETPATDTAAAANAAPAAETAQ